MHVYKIRIDQPSKSYDLCAQISLLSNAVENAMQIMSMGRRVVIKTEIEKVLHNGNETYIELLPKEGIHDVLEEMSPLEIRKNGGGTFILKSGEMQHWLDEPPTLVQIYLNLFYPEKTSEGEPWARVINMKHVNECLKPFGVELIETIDDDLSDPSIHLLSRMGLLDTPISTPIFRKIAFMLKMYPSCYEGVRRLLSIYSDGDQTENRLTSVVHLRNDNFAVSKWSRAQSMPEHDYLYLLHQKYIQCIMENLTKPMDIIVIGPTLNPNFIIDWMFTNGYRVRTIQKSISDDELCAMIDMAASENCNHTFITPYSISKRRGSLFSYISLCRLPSPVRVVSFDPLNITSDIVVHSSFP